jgi:hypothetical protein
VNALSQIVALSDSIPGVQSGWDEIKDANDKYAEIGRLVADLLNQVRDVPAPEAPTESAREVERLREIALELHGRIEKYTQAMKEIANQTNDYLVKHQINQILSGDK